MVPIYIVVIFFYFRQNLDEKLMNTRDALAAAEKQHAACLRAGPEFERIAQEYSSLKKDIESRSWALNELKTAKQHKT